MGKCESCEFVRPPITPIVSVRLRWCGLFKSAGLKYKWRGLRGRALFYCEVAWD